MTDKQKADALIQFIVDRVSAKYKYRVKLILPYLLCGINAKEISETAGVSCWAVTEVRRITIDVLRGSLGNGGTA